MMNFLSKNQWTKMVVAVVVAVAGAVIGELNKPVKRGKCDGVVLTVNPLGWQKEVFCFAGHFFFSFSILKKLTNNFP
jgi:hypothetical protein